MSDLFFRAEDLLNTVRENEQSWEMEVEWTIDHTPPVYAVELDVVAQMFYDFTGDLCPCNFNNNDEWLPEVCELLNECPHPRGDKLACWKQYIEHFQPRKESDG